MSKKKIAITLSAMLSATFIPNLTTDVHAEKKEETSSTKIELENGMTKPIYSLDEAIIENLFVETEVDSDRDGKGPCIDKDYASKD